MISRIVIKSKNCIAPRAYTLPGEVGAVAAAEKLGFGEMGEIVSVWAGGAIASMAAYSEACGRFIGIKI